MADDLSDFLVIGEVVGLYGVKGWVKVYAYTRPRSNIGHYTPWYLRMGSSLLQVDVADVRAQGQGVIALLEGYEDRDNARELLGSDILIRRSQLPPLAEDEHYWIDLLGMEVVTTQGVALGVVSEMLETGTHDVLVVTGQQEHLIHFVKDLYVVSIDKTHRRIEVDWDPDF